MPRDGRALWAAYPWIRGPSIVNGALSLLVAASLSAQLILVARWVRHGQRDVPALVALLLVFGTVGDAAGPYLRARPVLDAYLQPYVNATIWGAVAIVVLMALLRRGAPAGGA